jgi:spermidine synthase
MHSPAMPRPYTLLESVPTPEGLLELRQRGERDFLLTIRGQVLMTSALRRSEIELAQRGCEPISSRKKARVLIGGLGLGFTLRATLNALRKDAQVVVAELNPVVVRWCRGPLAVLTDDSLADPRVTVVERDVTELIRDVVDEPGAPRFDAIIWDLYRGPGCGLPRLESHLYGVASVQRTRRALSPGGVYAVWGEKRHAPFEARLQDQGFRLEQAAGRSKGPRHAVYIALK